MSGQNPPVRCADFKRVLQALGFTKRARKSQTAGSHESWVKTENGRLFKVTVDCPKSPFTGDLLASMAKQAGVTKKRIYEVLSTL